ncbi:MAG: VWA domain-containing protein [Chloroflexota bacterium]|nr:VWA domain-containing protein [Chloroflexota bacterium]
MAEKLVQSLDEIRGEISNFPPSLGTAFENSLQEVTEALNESQVLVWAQTGIHIAAQTARAWEVAAQYYSLSIKVIPYIPFSYFEKWADCGKSLCERSTTIGSAFFESSPLVISKLRSRHIENWSNLGASLYRGSWKSSTLACKFFEASPDLLESLTFPQLERFVSFLDSLSHRSYDLSAECLGLARKIFPLMGEDKDAFISLASTLVETSWREVKTFFEAGAKALPKITSGERMRFIKLSEKLVNSGCSNVPMLMIDMSASFSNVKNEYHVEILELSDSLVSICPEAVTEFIKSTPVVLERIDINQLKIWFEQGLSILNQNKDGGVAYFKMESSRAEQAVESISSSIEFERIKPVMEMYCRGLAGSEMNLAPSDDLVEKHIGWVSNELPSTEGSTVYVPALIDKYLSKEQNFSWLKVVSTHQVAHLEFGSFDFVFDESSRFFDDVRSDLEQARNEVVTENYSDDDSEHTDISYTTDIQRFFNLFDDRKLALDIFTVVEDGRLDAKIKIEYRGLQNEYENIQSDSMTDRPEIKKLPAREAMVEFLVLLSLQQSDVIPVPKPCEEQAKTIRAIAKTVFVPDAKIEDVAEATIRIYALIYDITNEASSNMDWEDLNMEDSFDESYEDPADMQQLLQQMAQGADMEKRSEEEEFQSSQEVGFRGDFKPELVQLLAQLRMQEGDAGADGSDPISQEALEELLNNSAELDLEAVQGDVQNTAGFANKLMEEAGANLPDMGQPSQSPLAHVDENGGSLEPDEPQTFVYDEWDFRADDYKPRWCIVKQKTMQEGDPSFYGNTLSSYGALVGRVRRQFELMVPETFRKVRKLEDGEEIDIDDVIEARVDIKTGVSPNDKLYWRRNKVQRDVSVALLLDTSASTAEAIDDGNRPSDEWNAPNDPKEYMDWLKTRRTGSVKRTYKRIIDVEKEAIVLLIHALEAIGDLYGIYGFSGYGRENVEYYTIKDLDENFSDRVKKRIDRVAPLHATRMGPAIRHTTSKLVEHDAKTKLLFLLSDGRPQDRGYSREGVEKEYAVHDTKMALDEAKAEGINAFCLTVDKNGHDYLKTMCEDIGYEVLDDINTLPERLLLLYRRLTM